MKLSIESSQVKWLNAKSGVFPQNAEGNRVIVPLQFKFDFYKMIPTLLWYNYIRFYFASKCGILQKNYLPRLRKIKWEGVKNWKTLANFI